MADNNLYLVGNLSNRSWFSVNVKFKREINKDDLPKVRDDDEFQVINMLDRTYYDPESNSWKEIKTE